MNNGKRHFNVQEKFEIVKEALISGASISEICRRSGLHSSQYYSWQRKFLEGALEKLKQYVHYYKNEDTKVKTFIMYSIGILGENPKCLLVFKIRQGGIYSDLSEALRK